jgi:hypothetical protein
VSDGKEIAATVLADQVRSSIPVIQRITKVVKAMKVDNDHPKVVYLNKYKRRRKISWPCAAEQHPWDWKNPWLPSKGVDSPRNGNKEER